MTETYVSLIIVGGFFFPPIAELVLKQEQEEYQREGIAWQNIEYFNNQIICDLVEQTHKGMIAIMDEACLNVGKVTDEVTIAAQAHSLGEECCVEKINKYI